jgi:hypothetical protein
MRPFLLGASKGPESAEGLTHLHMIMIRHFQRALGVDRLPGEYWQERWLWRPNPRWASLITPPMSAVVLPFARATDSSDANGEQS